MITFLILFCSVCISFYLYMTKNFDYWKKRGVFYLKPTPFIGNLGSIFMVKNSIGEFLRNIYNECPEHRYVGIWLANTPCLVVRDFDLVNRILKQDFKYFSSKMLLLSKDTDYIGSRSLFTIIGKEWKNTRARLSPVFSANRQRAVFDAMMRVGERLELKLKRSEKLEIKEISSCFAIDSISDSVLGLTGEAITNPSEDSMRKLGDSLFSERLNGSMRVTMAFLMPELLKSLNISVFSKWTYDEMRSVVQRALAPRRNQRRDGDYIDAMLELQEKGSWEGNNGEIIVPDDENLTGQFFMFFTAGFETVSSGVFYCLYELAINPDIQDKLRIEYNEALEKNDGKLTYESLNEMTYIENFVTECLRKNPPFPFLDRRCTADYNIPGTNLTIEKGTKVFIPVMGLQRDEMFYEHPDKIIPERFNDPNYIKNRPYLSFSTGPRACLGMKYTLQLLKISILWSLKSHRLTPTPETPRVIRMSPKRFGNTPFYDTILKVEKI